MEGSEKLKRELTGVAKYGNELPAPGNEASTCDWIILPVLQSLGYARHEILPQATDGRIGRPDYTILPETDYTWFVEAKAWSSPLESTQADQALNYAHANGRRWVLLTNGREWRLYDDRIHGRSEDRLVGVASLEEIEKCHQLLDSLTRASVISEKVERYVASTLVRKTLDTQLRDPSSTTIKALHKALKATMPIEPDVRDIVSYFANLGQFSHTPPLVKQIPNSISSDDKSEKPLAPSSPITTVEAVYELTFHGRGVADAQGTWDGKNLVVKAGSKGCKDPVPSYAQTFAQKHGALSSAYCRVEGACRITERDLTFNSPSGAAGFLNARSTNGWLSWLLPNGRPLADLRDQDKVI